ncbi:MAG TPA: hypothetical protein VIK87_07115, partial [Sphingomonadales bacterium]
LQGVKPQHRVRRGVGMAIDAENAAFFPQFVVVERMSQKTGLTKIRLMFAHITVGLNTPPEPVVGHRAAKDHL